MMTLIQEMGELGDRRALGDERIFDDSAIHITHRHAVDDHLVVRQLELLCDDPMGLRERGL